MRRLKAVRMDFFLCRVFFLIKFEGTDKVPLPVPCRGRRTPSLPSQGCTLQFHFYADNCTRQLLVTSYTKGPRAEKWVEAERLQMKMLLELGLLDDGQKEGKEKGGYHRVVMVPWDIVNAEVASLQAFGEHAVVADTNLHVNAGRRSVHSNGVDDDDEEAVKAQRVTPTTVVPIGAAGRESKINHGNVVCLQDGVAAIASVVVGVVQNLFL